MEKRFKFRAWNKTDNRMLYSYDFEYKREYALIEFGIGFSHYKKENLVIMQCTGIKDKNGKLIYEGDIVCSLYYTNKPPIHTSYRGEPELECHKGEIIGVVKYGKFIAGQEGGGHGCANQDVTVYGWHISGKDRNCQALYSNVEIIGCIHENPELSE